MHRSSFDKMLAFRDAYLGACRGQALAVLDVGSAAVTAESGTYRVLFEPPWRYVGLDTARGLNVDLAVREPYAWLEIEDASFDVVVSGQAFEHIAWPWLTIMEIARVLKPNGLAAITAPSAGAVHRYPLDCWRYYPDGLPALAAFAGLEVVEAHTSEGYAYPECASWGDSFVVLQRPLRDEVAERDWAVRRGALRVAAGLPAGPAGAIPPAASPIGPAENRDVFRKREAARLGELSAPAVKGGLLREAARRMRVILRTPLPDLTRG